MAAYLQGTILLSSVAPEGMRLIASIMLALCYLGSTLTPGYINTWRLFIILEAVGVWLFSPDFMFGHRISVGTYLVLVASPVVIAVVAALIERRADASRRGDGGE